jgi:hypothetical protein
VPGGVIKSGDHNYNYSDIASALTTSLATTGVSVMTGPIRAFQGAVGAPSYAFASALTTGFFLPGSNQMGWVANGSIGATFNADLSVTWNGAQTITGAITATGAISAGGWLSGSSISTAGSASVGGNILVGGGLGIAGNLAVSGGAAVSGKVSMLSTDSVAIANGTTAQRNVAPAAGDVRYNSTLGSLEFYNGGWVQAAPLSSSSAASVTIKNNAVTPNSKIDISAGATFLSNSSGIGVYASSAAVTIDLTVNGANGLDAGAMIGTAWYYLYLIGNGSTVAGLASLSSTAPTLPAGYAFTLRVGAMLTDGSNHLYRTIQKGNRGGYVISTATNTATFPFTNDTGGNSTWNAYTVAGVSIPSTATEINVQAGSNYPNNMGVAPNGSYAAPSVSATGNPSYFSSSTGNGSNSKVIPLRIVLESNAIYIWGTSTNDKVLVSGWRDSVNVC